MRKKINIVFVYAIVSTYPSLCLSYIINNDIDKNSTLAKEYPNLAKNTFPTDWWYDLNNLEEDKRYSLTILGAIGSRESINLLLKRKKLIKPYSYFFGAGVRTPEFFSFPIRFNIEAIKHFGRQKSVEITFYPSIESKPLHLNNIGFSWGIGDGVSIMTGPYPKFEVYNKVTSRRVLNFLLLEQNIFLKSSPECKVTIRWHHRCHCFKTIAPKGSGSNFFAVGIRYTL